MTTSSINIVVAPVSDYDGNNDMTANPAAVKSLDISNPAKQNSIDISRNVNVASLLLSSSTSCTIDIVPPLSDHTSSSTKNVATTPTSAADIVDDALDILTEDDDDEVLNFDFLLKNYEEEDDIEIPVDFDNATTRQSFLSIHQGGENKEILKDDMCSFYDMLNKARLTQEDSDDDDDTTSCCSSDYESEQEDSDDEEHELYEVFDDDSSTPFVIPVKFESSDSTPTRRRRINEHTRGLLLDNADVSFQSMMDEYRRRTHNNNEDDDDSSCTSSSSEESSDYDDFNNFAF